MVDAQEGKDEASGNKKLKNHKQEPLTADFADSRGPTMAFAIIDFLAHFFAPFASSAVQCLLFPF
jgi:hypothetical protein